MPLLKNIPFLVCFVIGLNDTSLVNKVKNTKQENKG